MSCFDYKDQILKFDYLSQKEQDHLLDHIEGCDECQNAFDHYLTLEETLDAVLQEEIIDLFSIKKQSRKQSWQRALLVCASLLLLTVGAWFTPPVKAVIEKALNLLILEKLTDMRQNVEGLENDSPDNPIVKVIFGIEVNQKGEEITSYLSGNKFREEYENGDFKISDGEKTALYSKEENLFFIEKSDEKTSIKFEKEHFEKMDPAQIKPLGEKSYLDRTVEVYRIHYDNGQSYEYWFDKETSMFMREIEVSDGIRIDHSKLIEFEIKEVERDHNLFDMTPPDGERVLTR